MNNKINYRITIQGAIIVNNCLMYIQNKNIITFVIDTKNKWGEISYTGSDENNVPLIGLEANKDTLNIKKGKTINDLTQIEFPEYAGWDVFTCTWSKYSIYVCMVKSENIAEQICDCSDTENCYGAYKVCRKCGKHFSAF